MLYMIPNLPHPLNDDGSHGSLKSSTPQWLWIPNYEEEVVRELPSPHAQIYDWLGTSSDPMIMIMAYPHVNRKTVM